MVEKLEEVLRLLRMYDRIPPEVGDQIEDLVQEVLDRINPK